MNKIYLLLILDDNRIDFAKFAETGRPCRPNEPIQDWILNDDIGINTISGFKLTEEDAKNWALERCTVGEELPDKEVSEDIVPFSQLIYVDHKCVLVEPDRWEKRVMFKGYRRKDLELPVFGYIELFERDDNKNWPSTKEVATWIEGEKTQAEEDRETEEAARLAKERNQKIQRDFDELDLRNK